MNLAGRTIFITGASRGIGKAIALRCAQDGANIVIAAKTAETHPKLPGTIYSAAQEVEAAGGQCLPCIVDIRSEDQVRDAVDAAVEKFGGIDILVNNASAISLTGTEATSMKKFDLMMSVNARGTYICSKYCVPHLKNGKNPHILNISPPLNMSKRWFKDHAAYTMAKYGMSMCALGMAEEFRDDGIAVNTLWPRTGIWTAAMEMLSGTGMSSKNMCRKPEIMSDAAYVILTKDSKSYTGQFCIDDTVLKEAGMTDQDLLKYSYVQDADLMPDFFLDEFDEAKIREKVEAQGEQGSQQGGVGQTFNAIKGQLTADLVKSIGGVFAFQLKGDEAGDWYLDLKNESGSVGQGNPPDGANCTMNMDSSDFIQMFQGKLKPTAAFMGGKLKIQGDLGMAMKLEKLMGQMHSKL